MAKQGLLLWVAIAAFALGCVREREPNSASSTGVSASSASEMEVATNRGIITGDVMIRTPDAQDLKLLMGNDEIRGDLVIENNEALTTLGGLETLRFVRGNLHVSYNPLLTSLEGLSGLQTVGGNLHISNNDALSSLGGLGSLTEVGGSVFIDYNQTLAQVDGSSLSAPTAGAAGAPGTFVPIHLSGPSRLTSVVGSAFSVTYNPLFPTCQAQSLVDQLDNFKGTITICENLADDCAGSQCF